MRHWAFGELTLPEGGAIFRDGGTHGVQGHAIAIDARGDARWSRRIDGVYPQGRVGSGAFRLDEDERARLRAWLDLAWDLRAAKEPPRAPPRWVWAIAQERAGEARMIDGGNGAPDVLRPALDWLRTRVDALSLEAPVSQLRLFTRLDGGFLAELDEGGVFVMHLDLVRHETTSLQRSGDGVLAIAPGKAWFVDADDDDRARLDEAARLAWTLGRFHTATLERVMGPPDPRHGRDAYALLARRGDELRGVTWFDEVDPAARPIFEWLRARVR